MCPFDAPTEPTNREERRRGPLSVAARYFQVHERTIFRWVDAGLIIGYLDGKTLLVDLDEIEEKLKTESGMRDGRRPRFSDKARLVSVAAPSKEQR